MKKGNEDYINYRVARAHEALDEAEMLWKAEHYNTSVSRLYYACFYIVDALLLRTGNTASTHSGTQNQFAKHFVKTGVIEKESGEFYYRLFQFRQESDYKYMFQIDHDLAEPWLAKATAFVAAVEQLIRTGEAQ